MGFLTRLIAGFVAASTLGAGLAGTANAVDAAGAASDTTGAVTTTADDTGGRTVLDCRQSGEGATGPYADKFCWIDWSNLPLDSSGKPTPVRINVPGGHIDADATITHTDNAALTAKDYTGSKWSRLTSAYKLTGNTALAFSGRMGRQDPAASVTFSNVTPSADRTDTGVNVLKDFQLAFGDAEVMSGGVLQGHDVYERTDIESDKTLEKLGMIGSGDPNQSYSKANTGYGTTHVTLAGGPKGATDDANKDSKGAAVVGAKQASRFKVSFGQVNQHWDGWGSAIAVGVYMPYLTAYPLTYDKNSTDATGEVPSNQRGKENTTQPAKTKTNGKIRLASDTSKLSDHLVNSDFEYLPDGGWKTVDAPSYMTNAYTSVDPNNGQYMRNAKHVDADLASWVDWPGFDQSKFAWKTDQKGGHDQGGLKDRANAVELQQDSTDGNTYAEMVASETGRTIYQNLATIPGTLYKIRLKHASLCKDNVDKMQVVINGTPIEMTRVTANGKAGDKVGEKSTTIATKVTNENRWHHADQWETYEGYYVIPDGQTTTRFGFKAVNYLDPTKGNLLDDVAFACAYKLSYDKNATDANGSVPSDTTEGATKQAKAKTTGTVKTVADENVRYGSLANGDFSYPSFSDIQKNEQEGHADLRTFLKSDDGTLWYNMSATDLSKYGKIGQIPGFDSSRFAWSSTENGSRVELQQDRNTKNTYAEIVAQQDNTSIYQNVSTGNGGVLYKIRLKHASRQSSHADRMQVLVGSDTAHATPVEMTRVTSNGHGDKVGGKSTTITTKVSNTDPRDHGSQWETYEGYYQVPEGQKNTVFMFKSLEGFKEYETLPGNNIGNLVDDIEFSRSYKLTYDANSSDASGQVPSDTTANTVKQAKARTTGTVRAVADRTASGLTVHDLKNGEIAPVQYGDFKFSTVNGFSADQVTNVNGFTVKTNWDPCEENQAYAGVLATMYQPNKNGANLILHHVGQWRDSSGTQRWLNARITVNGQNLGTLVYIPSTRKFVASYGKWDKHPSSRPYMDVTVDFLLDDGSTPQGLRGATGFTDIDGGTSGYNEGVELVSGFDGAYVRSDAHLARFGTNGWAGITDENKHDADAHGMKHYVGATFTGSSFRVRWSVASGQARQSGFQPVDSTIAYRLTYNKNAQDATGSIPSDTAADTIRPAKSETDGKVSDLVQRTTTHEDGSVTVKTIDTSTDVVSGCQVYYPAGQRITLATMAKDDDCWDSSMLSRPGHTQLGWNQDRNATQAQAQVTMVEGGMTVYAVWVGNPVLTYDTNKPSTWSGQMPSTPASVSVAYNTAAADGSGWRAGDVSKIRGYRFLGWYTGPQDNAGLYDWNTLLTGSVTVYAHWQRLQANVIYDKNGGTGSHANTTGWQYSDVTVPSDTSKSFKRDGYYFKYWNTQKDGKGTTYKDGGQVPLQDKDVTLYAIWAPYHTVITETGGVGLPVLVAAGMGLLVVGIGSTVMLTRRMRGEQ
ncbi:InlB B-repeat-containing protein [Bifidobacterium adolescentis]